MAWLEIAWDVQVGELGFNEPLNDNGLGGNDYLDVYLVVDETGEAGVGWVDCDGGDGTCIDADPKDNLAAASSFIVIDARTENLRPFVVHEFNHVLQYATDYAEPFLVAWEGTAVASEHWTLPDWFPESWQAADYQACPWASAVLQDGYFLWDYKVLDLWYEYGAFLWVLYLDHTWGDGQGSVGPALWDAMTQEGYAFEPDILDAWQAISGDWRSDLMEFEIERARMAVYHDSPTWIAFAEDYALAWREASETALPATLEPTLPPFPLGVSYWDVLTTPGNMLELQLSSKGDTDWGLLVVEGGDSTWIIGDTLEYGPILSESVTVGVVNVGGALLDADDPLTTSSFTLSVQEAPAPEDTGYEAEYKEPSCGCSGISGGASLWIPSLLSLSLLLRSRRRVARRDASLRQP